MGRHKRDAPRARTPVPAPGADDSGAEDVFPGTEKDGQRMGLAHLRAIAGEQASARRQGTEKKES
jgi:hypothetical protein